MELSEEKEWYLLNISNAFGELCGEDKFLSRVMARNILERDSFKSLPKGIQVKDFPLPKLKILMRHLAEMAK